MTDYRAKVIEVYSKSVIWTNRAAPVAERSEVWYYDETPVRRFANGIQSVMGWTQLTLGHPNSKEAWKMAWKNIEREMLETLEQ